jgi:hypothetical protein
MNNVTGAVGAPTTETPKARGMLWWGIRIGGGLLFLLVLAFATMAYSMNSVPADLDTSTALATEQGLFQTSYAAQYNPMPINQIQSWTLHVTSPDGQPVENAQIRVDGDMPRHGHGLPTKPEVTRYLGNGDYLVEGLKFHMPGWWVVDFHIDADGQSDKVRFNLLLK